MSFNNYKKEFVTRPRYGNYPSCEIDSRYALKYYFCLNY